MFLHIITYSNKILQYICIYCNLDENLISIYTSKNESTKFKPDKTLAQRRGSEQKVPPLTKISYLQLCQRERKNQFSGHIHQPHSGAGPMLGSSWSAQNGIYFFVCVCEGGGCFVFFICFFFPLREKEHEVVWGKSGRSWGDKIIQSRYII